MDARQLHADALIFDAHRDVAYEAPWRERFLAQWLIGVDLFLPLLEQGGIDIQTFAFCVAPVPGLPPTAEVLRELDMVLEILDAHSDQATLVTSMAEARAARAGGRIAIFLSLEGSEPVLDHVGLMRMFYRLGVRAASLTWNFRNPLADGAREADSGNISKVGHEVVREMNRLGMVVDLAHLSQPGMRDLLRVVEQPLIHSHGVTRGAVPERKGAIPDDILEGIAANGGVFCITSVPEAIDVDPKDADLGRMLDHVDHAVKIMGVEHVGLGADFDVYLSHLGLPAERWLTDLEEADKWPDVTAGLLRRGYSEADVRAIMGENLARVYEQVCG